MMTLHLNPNEFKDLITIASQNSGISSDIIEKDYYVTLMLQELSIKQKTIDAYFKGGTCLYKIYAPMQRFSEDIDITVQSTGLSTSKTKHNLRSVSKEYSSLSMDTDNLSNENRKGSITQVFNYHSCFNVPDDPLQRYEKVKIEATSFTVSEPYETNMIHSLLLDALPDNIKDDVKLIYGLEDFSINNITLERIFCDKLLAAEFYAERDEKFDVAKHIYDIVNMMQMPRIQNMLCDKEAFIENMSYKRLEETKRIGSDLSGKPLSNLCLYNYIKLDAFKAEYEKMQGKYVFDKKYQIPYANIVNYSCKLEKRMKELSEHELDFLQSEEFHERIIQYNPELKQ